MLRRKSLSLSVDSVCQEEKERLLDFADINGATLDIQVRERDPTGQIEGWKKAKLASKATAYPIPYMAYCLNLNLT